MQLHEQSIARELIPFLSFIQDQQIDGENLFHAWRVAVVSVQLLPPGREFVRTSLFWAGLLHDIGLADFPEHVTQYAEDYQQKRTVQFREHPAIGANMVGVMPGMSASAVYIRDHHEWFNGNGYPAGKRYCDISLGGQLLRIADSFDLFLRKKPAPNMPETYDFLRRNVNKMFGEELWPNILRLFDREGRMFYYEIADISNVPAIFGMTIESIPPIAEFDEKINIETVLRLIGRVVDAKHKYTHGHTERVAEYSEDIARRMGFSGEEMRDIKYAALLHDLGKLGIPSGIMDKTLPLSGISKVYPVDKPGRLIKEEMAVIRNHPILPLQFIDTIPFLRHISPIVRHHHEKFDGTGYPDRLKGREIPIGSRIISVADTIDAMTSDRAYRRAISLDKVIEELRRLSGIQFDPDVVSIALDLLSGRRFNYNADQALYGAKELGRNCVCSSLAHSNS